MEQFFNKLPRWVILGILGYVAVLVSYAVFDNRRVQLWPPVIDAKGESSSRQLPKYPWVTIDTVVPKFAPADCSTRLPASLGMASTANIQPATWGGQGGLLWFGELKGNTVWLACPQIGPASVIIVGAAGPEPQDTKNAVDLLVSVVSK